MSFGAAPAFGAPAASSAAAPAFGSTSTFGGFAQNKPVGAAAPTFGAAAPTAGGFTGFGAGAGTSTVAATPAFSGFGAPAASSAPSLAFSGFGAPAATKPASLSFGTTTTASSFSGFGAPTALGGGTGLQPAGGLFSQQPRPAFAPAGTGTLGFGQSFQQPFQQQQQQQQILQQQQQPQQQVEQLYNSVMHCSLFGDERDPILAKWNMLQASWGVGSAFFAHPPVPPLTLTPENPICRFKTVGYSAMPTAKDQDGLMSAIIRQKAADLSAQKDKISAGILQTVLMNKPNVKVCVDEVRSAAVAGGQGEASEVVFHVQNLDPQTGQTKKVAASEMSAFLSQPMQQQNLAKLGIEQVVPKLPYSETEIKEYLTVPPKGIDPRLWKQAQLDNPDPKSLLPIPLMGFKALQQRIQCQDSQTKLFQSRLLALSDVIEDLQKRQQDTQAKIRDAKRRQLALSHRVLHIMVRQEGTRQIGFTIRPEEEKLRIHLEALQSEMSAPTQFKGRLNELLSQVRLQSQSSIMSSASNAAISIDPYYLHDIKKVLKQHQDGIQAMVSMLKQDIVDLELVEELAAKDKKDKSI